MSISDNSGNCIICKEFCEKRYDHLDVMNRVGAMYKDVLEINEHFRKDHIRNAKQFAFTFTTNQSREEIEAQMLYSCYKLFSQQTVPIQEGEAYLEYTEQGRPHIHGWYETIDGGRVFSKVFARCWPYWKEKRGQTAFAGGFHEQMKSNRYKGYASSEGRVIIIKKKNEPLIYNAPTQADQPPPIAQDDPSSQNGNGT